MKYYIPMEPHKIEITDQIKEIELEVNSIASMKIPDGVRYCLIEDIERRKKYPNNINFPIKIQLKDYINVVHKIDLHYILIKWLYDFNDKGTQDEKR